METLAYRNEQNLVSVQHHTLGINTEGGHPGIPPFPEIAKHYTNTYVECDKINFSFVYMVSEAVSEVVNFKIFLGEHAPRPP